MLVVIKDKITDNVELGRPNSHRTFYPTPSLTLPRTVTRIAMVVATEPNGPSNHLALEPMGLTPSFGSTPGFFSTEFGTLNPFDEDFHNAIARASGSIRLCQDIDRYRLLHRGFNKLATNVEVLQAALREHFQILDALENRDEEAAARLMVEHIQEWQAYFVNHFPRQTY